jgi:putative DNA primase/helicase
MTDYVAQALGEVEGGSAQLILRCAADIVPRRIEFLWPGRIARGKHTAIAGEPGDGKSQLSVYIAATISRGEHWPCNEGHAPVGNVIILNAEDGADDTVVPRLMAAGADLGRVHIVSAVFQESAKGRRSFNLQADLQLLERKITQIGDVVLVIIDPISSYMGKADSHKNAEVRGALEPLSEMADRLKVAILSITHFSKSGAANNSKALHRFIGSIAFVGAPRAAFAVIEDADNDGRILFLHAKNNMAGKPQGWPIGWFKPSLARATALWRPISLGTPTLSSYRPTKPCKRTMGPAIGKPRTRRRSIYGKHWLMVRSPRRRAKRERGRKG